MTLVVMPEEFTATLLVEAATNVRYTNQAGGTICAQPSAEGYLVPINFDYSAISKLLRDYWFEHSLQIRSGYFVYPFTREELNKALAGALDGGDGQLGIEVRSQSEDWGEAWVPVTSVYGDGFLIWPNSD